MEAEKSSLKEFLPTKEELPTFLVALFIVLLGLFIDVYFYIIRSEGGMKTRGIIVFIIGLVSPFLGLYLWYKYIPRFSPKVLKFLVENKFGRILLGGGSFAYYEYKPPEEKESVIRPVSRLITVLIAYLGFAVMIAKLLSKFIPLDPKSPIDTWGALIIWIILMFLIPILLAPVTPIIWGLEDTQIKAWASGNKTNWMISAKYKMRFNSILSLGAIISGIGVSTSEIGENLSFFFNLVLASFLILLLPNSLIILSYYMYFKDAIYGLIKENVKIPTYETKLIEKEEKPSEEITIETEQVSEKAIAPEVKEESVPEVKEESVPEVKEEPVPEVKEEPVPEVKEEPVPEVKEEPTETHAEGDTGKLMSETKQTTGGKNVEESIEETPKEIKKTSGNETTEELAPEPTEKSEEQTRNEVIEDTSQEPME